MKKETILPALILCLYLGTAGGNLALWRSGSPQPLKVYPYSASLYTKIDQSAFKKGIKVTSNAEITKLLDDFLS